LIQHSTDSHKASDYQFHKQCRVPKGSLSYKTAITQSQE